MCNTHEHSGTCQSSHKVGNGCINTLAVMMGNMVRKGVLPQSDMTMSLREATHARKRAQQENTATATMPVNNGQAVSGNPTYEFEG